MPNPGAKWGVPEEACHQLTKRSDKQSVLGKIFLRWVILSSSKRLKDVAFSKVKGKTSDGSTADLDNLKFLVLQKAQKAYMQGWRYGGRIHTPDRFPWTHPVCARTARASFLGTRKITRKVPWKVLQCLLDNFKAPARLQRMQTAMGSMLGKIDVETPKYELVRSGDGYEIRKYAPQVAVRTAARGGINTSFNLLASYIGVFGSAQNVAAAGPEKIAMTAPVVSEKIAMTAPVVSEKSENYDTESTSFILPSTYTSLAQAPVPTHPQVTLHEIPERLVAVTQFAGAYDVTNVYPKVEELRKRLSADGIKVVLGILSQLRRVVCVLGVTRAHEKEMRLASGGSVPVGHVTSYVAQSRPDANKPRMEVHRQSTCVAMDDKRSTLALSRVQARSPGQMQAPGNTLAELASLVPESTCQGACCMASHKLEG
eukprot:jgi/Mesvir1/29633/Mv21483-RA.1